MAPKRKSSGSRTPRGLSGETVQGCLATLGLTDLASAITGCANIEDEFKVIKRAWHKQCLSAHPDKGGSEELFRAVQAAFEVLKARAAGHELRRLHGYVDHARRAALSMPWVADLDGEAI